MRDRMKKFAKSFLLHSETLASLCFHDLLKLKSRKKLPDRNFKII